jgi:two-component system LytT family response regulator
MEQYKAVAIDDSPEALINLVSTLTSDFSDRIRLVGTGSNVEEGLRLIKEKNPQIVFFDVELGGGATCFDILSQIQDPQFFSVFVTGFEHYALKAFEFAALDYIMKPASTEDLDAVLSKIDKLQIKSLHFNHELKSRLDTFDENELTQSTRKVKKIVLNTDTEMFVANVDDIIRCESDKGYTTFYMSDQNIMVSKVIKEYAEMLADYGFFRPHKSHLINLEYVKTFKKADGGYISMKDGSNVPLSVRKKQAFLELLQNIG